MTPERRKELRELADAATPGPWFVDEAPRLQGAVSTLIEGLTRQVAHADGQAAMFDYRADTAEIQRANAAFIAAARTAVPDLLDALHDAECYAAKAATTMQHFSEQWRLSQEAREAVEAERDVLRAKLDEGEQQHQELVDAVIMGPLEAGTAKDTIIALRAGLDAALAERDALRARVAELQRDTISGAARLEKLERLYDVAKTWCDTVFIGKPHPRFPAYPNDELLHAVLAIDAAERP